MSVEVPAHMYQAMARGDVDASAVAELESVRDLLNEKVAASSFLRDVALPAAGSVALGTAMAATGAVATVGATLAAGAAAHAFSKGVDAAVDKLTFNSDLQGILRVHPDLAQQYPKRDIDLAYTSVRTLNPTLSKDPLIAGTLLSQVLRNRSAEDPHSAPRFDMTMAKLVTETGAKIPFSKTERLTEQAFSAGLNAGANAFVAGSGGMDGVLRTSARRQAAERESAHSAANEEAQSGILRRMAQKQKDPSLLGAKDRELFDFARGKAPLGPLGQGNLTDDDLLKMIRPEPKKRP